MATEPGRAGGSIMNIGMGISLTGVMMSVTQLQGDTARTSGLIRCQMTLILILGVSKEIIPR